MLKFNEQQQIEAINGALALRPQVEEIVDGLYGKFDVVYYLGIGGTYASAMQAVTYINGKSDLPVFIQHAAEYYTTGNKRLTKESIVVLSSVTGTTQEVVRAVEDIKSRSNVDRLHRYKRQPARTTFVITRSPTLL